MAALNERGLAVRNRRGYFMAQCPTHPDREPSLSIRPVVGKVWLHCWAGCDKADVREALNLSLADLFDDELDKSRLPTPVVVAEYDYLDEHGELLFRVERRFPKGFRQKRPDGKGGWVYNTEGVRRVLYRLPAVLAAVAEGRTVWVAEGEKDVAAIERAGEVATCNPGGVGMGWHPSYGDALKGADVVIVADRDDKGREHARRVLADLEGKAKSVVVVEAAAGKDATDHFFAGHTLVDFLPAGEAPTPPPVVTEQEAPRRVRLTKASTIKPRPVRWVWEDRMPSGSITLIPGREGIGKSLTLVWLTAQLTRGTLPGVHFGAPRPVIYAATEDSWAHTIVPRLMVAGADLEMVYRVDVVTQAGREAPLTLPDDCEGLVAEIRAEGVAMLALDPLMSVIGHGIDTHRDRELRTALDPLAKLADETGCAIGALAHFNKSSSNDALNLITGSRAFSAVARAVVAVARDDEAEDGSCVLSQAKNNLGRLSVPHLRYVVDEVTLDTEEGPAKVGKLRFIGESDRGVTDILGNSDGDDKSSRAEAAEWLKNYIGAKANKEAAATDVMRDGTAAGFSRDQLKRAKAKAKIESRKAAFGEGWVWALSDPEESAKGAKGAGHGDMHPSHSSALPSPETAEVVQLFPGTETPQETSC
ncbi:ATP-binding protein [Nonomuraea coxensis]|nr:AAA family ATPase [Nonomuraea coxensis]